MRKTMLWMVMILAAAAAARAERPVEESRPVSAGASIDIENVAGSLEISGWDRNELKLTGTLGDDVEALEIEGDDDDLRVEVVIPERMGRDKPDIEAHLELWVPRGCELDVETVSAPITIEAVDGDVEAAAVSGAVTVTGGSASVEAESVSGAVTVSGSSGSVEAESVSGAVRLDDVAGEVEATTVSGGIEVRAGAVRDVELESVSGSIHFDGLFSGGALEAESHSGNVELVLPADISASFEVETFSGQIQNDLGGPQARRVDRYEPGMSLEFTAGSGAAQVSVETFSGNIVLKKR